MKKKLLRQKISYEIDTPANDVIKKVSDVITKNSVVNFNDVVSQIGSNVSYGSSGWVPKTNQDGGLSLVASKLNKGKFLPLYNLITVGDIILSDFLMPMKKK
jgi:hypothetical protein